MSRLITLVLRSNKLYNFELLVSWAPTKHITSYYSSREP